MKYFFFAVTSATAAQLEDSMEVANNWHSESQAWMSQGNMFRPAYKTQAMIMNPEPPVQHVLQGGSADHREHRQGLNDFNTNFQAHPRAPASLLNVINDAPAKTAGHKFSSFMETDESNEGDVATQLEAANDQISILQGQIDCLVALVQSCNSTTSAASCDPTVVEEESDCTDANDGLGCNGAGDNFEDFEHADSRAFEFDETIDDDGDDDDDDQE